MKEKDTTNTIQKAAKLHEVLALISAAFCALDFAEYGSTRKQRVVGSEVARYGAIETLERAIEMLCEILYGAEDDASC